MQMNQEMLAAAEPGIRFASKLAPRVSYSIKDDAAPVAGSVPTAYRRLHVLQQLGLATVYRGQFQINRAARQPMHVLEKLVPSLLALKNAKRFGKKYHISDINFFKKNLPEKSFITLDFRAWELTGYQTPRDLYVYVDDIENATKFLRQNGFSEGSKGRVVLLQKQTSCKNNIEQIYLDCIARGGRSTLDAIAIELKHADHLTTRGRFNIADILKVQDDMQEIIEESI